MKSIVRYISILIIVVLIQGIVEMNPIYWNWVTNSDQLTIPQFTSDILKNPKKIQGFQLSRAPYLFPDSIIAFFANIFTDSPQRFLRTQGILFLFLQLIIFIQFLLIFINRQNILALFSGIFVWTILPLLFNQLPAWLTEPFIILQVSNATHFSSILLVLLLITFCELTIFPNRRTSIKLSVLVVTMAIVCFCGALSDKLFAALSLPLLLLYLSMTFLIREENVIQWKKISFLFSSIFFLILGFLSENLLNRQPDTFSITHQLIISNIHTIFKNITTAFGSSLNNTTLFPTSIIILSGILYIFVNLICFGIKMKKHCSEKSTLHDAIAHLFVLESRSRLQVCCFLSTALGLMGPLTLNADIFYTARYYTAVIYFPLVHLAVSTGNALSNINIKRLSFIHKINPDICNLFSGIYSILGIISVILFLTICPYNPYILGMIDQAQNLSKCINSHGLKTGAASYWVARKMNFLSNGHLDILPAVPWNLDQGYFYWGTNVYETLDYSHNFKPISYFVIQGDESLTSLTKSAGSENKIDCAGLQVIVYDNPESASRLFYRNSFNVVLNHTKFLQVSPNLLPCTTGSNLSRNRLLDPRKDKPGYAFFGPYVRVAKGKYNAGMKIYMFSSQESQLGDAVGKLDIMHSSGSACISQTEVFWSPGEKNIKLEFSVQKEISDLEIRFLWNGKQNVMIEDVTLEFK